MTDPLDAVAAGMGPEASGKLALIAGGAELTFADLGRRVARAQAALERAGVGPGSRVALRATNRLETVVMIHALVRLGAPLVPIHPRSTDVEAAALVRDVEPTRVLDDAAVDALVAGAPAANCAPARDEPILAIVYTSGTTGRPKGAILGRDAFVASAAASAENLGWTEDDRWLLCMPLCHIGGLSISTRCLLARRPVILEPHGGARFEPRAVLSAIERHRATLLSVVPTMLRALLDEDRRGALARLRVVLVGGAAAPSALLAECARRGVPALTTYGLTEACSQVTAQRPRAVRSSAPEPGCGRPLRGVEIRIQDDEDDAPPGVVGRIHVRGATCMRGYWNDRPLAPGAWLDTGDLGEIDEEGRLFVHARRTDLIVTGGENVYPVEVEQVLEACHGVERALVFGIPDERWGQLVAAAIVPQPGRDLDDGRLSAELAARLSPHKRPRALCQVEALPITAAGKPDRAGAALLLAPRLRSFT